MGFIYTYIHDDDDYEAEVDWEEVADDTAYAIRGAKTILDDDDDDSDDDDGHECPVSELFRRQVEAW
jgi:hypothetical protein